MADSKCFCVQTIIPLSKQHKNVSTNIRSPYLVRENIDFTYQVKRRRRAPLSNNFLLIQICCSLNLLYQSPTAIVYVYLHMLLALNAYFNGLITLETCGANAQTELKLLVVESQVYNRISADGLA